MHLGRRLFRPSCPLLLLVGLQPLLAAGPSAVELMPPQALAGVVIQHPDKLLTRLHEWIDDESGPAAPLLEQLASKPELAQARLIYLGLAASAGRSEEH